MTEMPSWWIYATGIFSIVGIFLFAGLLFAVLKVVQTAKTVQEKLEGTIKRAEAVVDRLEGVAKTAQTTVDSIGGSARNVATRVEGFVESTAERAAPITSFLMIAMTGLKLYQQFSEMRRSHHADAEEEDEETEGMNVKRKHVPANI